MVYDNLDHDSALSDSDTLASYRSRENTPAFHDYGSMLQSHEDMDARKKTHKSLSYAERMVDVTVKDDHDANGEGMTFTLGYTSNLKNVFDAFKAASCKTCRVVESIRFKDSTMRLKDANTPKSLSLKHNDTLYIRAFSNSPGLCCATCQKTGYPNTGGETYNGNAPLLHLAQSKQKQLIRPLFQDPNGKITGLPVKSTYSMKHTMGSYARRESIDLRLLRFFFEGERIMEADTPEEVSWTAGSQHIRA